jgi:hypothetical protein
MDCWAKSLGGCSGGLSREHYVSKGIFEDSKIVAFGLPWCNDQPKTIGLASAVAKILCQTHNSALSVYDTEASRLSCFLTECVLDRPELTESICVKGAYFEKWALKTMLNLWTLGVLDMGKNVQPNPNLVDALFQSAGLSAPRGLYFIGGGTMANKTFKNGLAWNAIKNISDPQHPVVGMAFAFNDLNFAISISGVPAESALRTIGERRGVDYANWPIVYRPQSIRLQGDRSGSKRIHFDWKT